MTALRLPLPLPLRLASLTLALGLIAACSGDDDSLPAPTTEAAATSEPAGTAPAPATTVASTPPTTAPPPAAERIVIPGGVAEQPIAQANELLAPANGRGLLLVGWQQPGPGQRQSVAMWESVDGLTWTAVDELPFHAGVEASANAATWQGTILAVGGGMSGSDGVRRPAVWLASDGATFAAPENPFNAPGEVVALAPTDTAWVAAGGVYATNELRPAVALRDSSGKWTPAQLPPAAEGMAILGLATSGSTVVATGWTPDNRAAIALVSTDGGATFTMADTSAFSDAGTAMGDVIALPTGFVAVPCGGSETALATSPDGATWQRVDINATSPRGSRFRTVSERCPEITAGPDGVLVGVLSPIGWLLSLDLNGQGRAFPGPVEDQFPIDVPLAAWTGDRTVIVGRESGGFTAALEANGSTQGTSLGLPAGAPPAKATTVRSLAGGLLAGVELNPVLTKNPEGGFVWGAKYRWATSTDGRTWTEDTSTPAEVLGVTSNGALEVAWGSVTDDPTDVRTPAAPLGGTGMWARTPGQPWEFLGIAAGGPGGEALLDVVTVPGGFVAVGRAAIFDGNTGASSVLPLAMASADGRTWGNEQPPPTEQGGFERACVLPGGDVLAVGGSPLLLARRAADGSWSSVDPTGIPEGLDDFDDCLPGPDALTLVATVDDHPVVVRTTDGTTFTATPLDDPAFAGTSFSALARSGTTLIAVGIVTEAGGPSDPAVWTSGDGQHWERLAVTGLSGPGAQFADDVEVVGDSIVVAGRDRDAPVVWRVPAP